MIFYLSSLIHMFSPSNHMSTRIVVVVVPNAISDCNMSHKSRRAPPIECPLASLGHNGHHTQNPHHQPYHHPLSTSPLNPDVYQMSRTSPILNIGISDGLLFKSRDDVVSTAMQSASNQSTPQSVAHHVYSNQSLLNRSATPAKTKNFGTNSSTTTYRSLPCNYNAEDSDNVSCEPGLTRRVAASVHGDGRSSAYRLSGREQYASRATSDNGSEQYFLDDKMRKLYIPGDGGYKSSRQYDSGRYYLEENYDDASPNYLHRTSSPSETSGSDRYLIGRVSRESPAPPLNGSARRSYNYLVNHHRTPSGSLTDGLSRLGRLSPNYDQGYHTLASTSQSTMTEDQLALLRNRPRGETPFNKLPDKLSLKIFSWLDSCDLCNVSKVCKRFDALVWTPSLWKTIKLKGDTRTIFNQVNLLLNVFVCWYLITTIVRTGEYINGDRALRSILRRLSMQTRNVACPEVERVFLSEGCRITDRGMELLTRRCPELTHLQIQMSFNITNNALFNLVTKCTNLQHLDVTGNYKTNFN